MRNRFATSPEADEAPSEQTVTDYDHAHLKLYARLLDAERENASLIEIAQILLGIDAVSEPERAQRVHASHLERARWMTEHGYRDMLARGLP